MTSFPTASRLQSPYQTADLRLEVADPLASCLRPVTNGTAAGKFWAGKTPSQGVAGRSKSTPYDCVYLESAKSG